MDRHSETWRLDGGKTSVREGERRAFYVKGRGGGEL